MEIVILPTAVDVARVAAAKVAGVVRAKSSAVVGLATGSSPLGVYADLARRVRAGEVGFGAASGFALDEYVGLPRGHPQSYAAVVAREVVGPLGFDPSRVWVPEGWAEDLAGAAARFEARMRAVGGVDVQILGIGANGHIGFNEPSSSLSSRTRVKTLAGRTRVDNARFFAASEVVPRHCLTQGLGTILEAREVVLVAQGAGKAAAVAAAVEGPVSAFVPGSVLQWHPRATVVVDEAAAAGLVLGDYYRDTFRDKPAWQRWDD